MKRPLVLFSFLFVVLFASISSAQILDKSQLHILLSFCKKNGTHATLSGVTVYGLSGQSWAKTKEDGLLPCEIYLNAYQDESGKWIGLEVRSEITFKDGAVHQQIALDENMDTIPDQGRVVIFIKKDGNYLKQGDTRWVNIEIGDDYYITFEKVLKNIFAIAATEKTI